MHRSLAGTKLDVVESTYAWELFGDTLHSEDVLVLHGMKLPVVLTTAGYRSEAGSGKNKDRVQERLVVLLSDSLVGNPDPVGIRNFWIGLLCAQQIGGVNGLLTLRNGILEHGVVQLTLVHRLESIMAGIRAANRNLSEFSGSLNGLQCAQRHLVVVGGNAVDLLAGSQPVFHNGLALLTLPVAGLFADDLDIREFFFGDFFDSIRTTNGCFIAQLTHQDDQITFAAHSFAQLLHVHDSGLNGVGTTIHNRFRQVGRQAVDVDQRLTGFDQRLCHRAGSNGGQWEDYHLVHCRYQAHFD